MKLDRAVVKLTDSFREEVPELPLPLILLVERYLGMAYTVGFEEGKRHDHHCKPVVMLKNNVPIKEFDNMTLAASFLDVTKMTISKVTGTSKAIKGYHFRYISKK